MTDAAQTQVQLALAQQEVVRLRRMLQASDELALDDRRQIVQLRAAIAAHMDENATLRTQIAAAAAGSPTPYVVGQDMPPPPAAPNGQQPVPLQNG